MEVVDVRRTIKLGKDESAPPLIRVTGGKNKRCSSPDGRTKRRSLNPLSPPRRSKSITFEICVVSRQRHEWMKVRDGDMPCWRGHLIQRAVWCLSCVAAEQ